MKYEEMSDFEINKSIHFKLLRSGQIKEKFRFSDADYVDVFRNSFVDKGDPTVIAVIRYVKDGTSDGYNPFGPAADYCNNPSDAWGIINNNGIGLIAEGGKIIGATNNSQEYYESYGSIVFDYLDKNPLRAAMIVFLMMNEEQK